MRRIELISFLIVEDDPEITEVIKDLLTSNYPDSIVKCSPNGKDAIELCKQVVFDVVFTDLLMPVMSGDELIAQLRDNFLDFQSTPIVVISALVNKRPRGEERKSVYFLEKPFSRRDLVTLTNLAKSC